MKRTLIGLAVLALALCAPAGVAAGRGEGLTTTGRAIQPTSR